MEQTNIEEASRQKANSFIKNLKKSDKTALISHTDPDGIASAKIISQIVKPEVLKFIGYDCLNEKLVAGLKAEKVNKVIFTDISINEKDFIREIEKFAEILIIDHHQFKENLNSQKTVFINIQGYCAAYICFLLFQDNEKVKQFEWLAAITSITDWCWTKNADWLKEVYKKYGEKFDINKTREGKFFEIGENINRSLIYFRTKEEKVFNLISDEFSDFAELNKYAEEIKKELKIEIGKFKKEKEEIKQGYFYESKSRFSMISEISTEVSQWNISKIFVISRKKEDLYKISARRQDKKISLSSYLQKATQGFQIKNAGGHIAAAGCSVSLKDYPEFKRRLKEMNLEDLRV